MTAILSPTDAFRRECLAQDNSPCVNHHQPLCQILRSCPSSRYPSSAAEWRAKYQEVADMLAETRAELDEFQQSSKELEEELEAELERTEKAQKDLVVKASKAESERDEWKVRRSPCFDSDAHQAHKGPTNRPNSCPFKRNITQPSLLFSVSWTNYVRNTRRSRYNYESLRWATTIWNGMNAPYHQAYRTPRLSIHAH